MESDRSSAPLHQVVGQIENICHQLGNNDPDSSMSVIDLLLLDDRQEAVDRLLEIEDSLAAIRAAILPNPERSGPTAESAGTTGVAGSADAKLLGADGRAENDRA